MRPVCPPESSRRRTQPWLGARWWPVPAAALCWRVGNRACGASGGFPGAHETKTEKKLRNARFVPAVFSGHQARRALARLLLLARARTWLVRLRASSRQGRPRSDSSSPAWAGQQVRLVIVLTSSDSSENRAASAGSPPAADNLDKAAHCGAPRARHGRPAQARKPAWIRATQARFARPVRAWQKAIRRGGEGRPECLGQESLARPAESFARVFGQFFAKSSFAKFILAGCSLAAC